MTLKNILTLIGLFVMISSSSGLAAEIKGVSFADQVTLEKNALFLKGVAVLKWAMLFDVYAGAFYLPSKTPGAKWTDNSPKRLELSYFRDIKAQGFADASDKLLRENLEPSAYQNLSARLQTFYAFFQDVRPGDRYSINYTPERGTELMFNDRSVGRVSGHDFAVAYFGIWLGERPINTTFRDKLLGVEK